MMSAESEIYSILSAHAGVNALVDGRIYPDLVPLEKAAPYIGFERVGTRPVSTIHGTILGNDVQMVIACWANTRLEAESIADTVAVAMQDAGQIYTARGAELDDSSGRTAATLDYDLLIT
jgi:hypothetical protein